MTLTLRIVLFIFTIVYILLVIKKIKKRQLQISFALFWLISGGILVIILIFPNIIDILSNNMGFKTPSNMLFVLSIFIAYYLIFGFTAKLSQEYKKNIVLIQEISILKKRIENIEKKNMEN